MNLNTAAAITGLSVPFVVQVSLLQRRLAKANNTFCYSTFLNINDGIIMMIYYTVLHIIFIILY
jgi:hypothetical protein